MSRIMVGNKFSCGVKEMEGRMDEAIQPNDLVGYFHLS